MAERRASREMRKRSDAFRDAASELTFTKTVAVPSEPIAEILTRNLDRKFKEMIERIDREIVESFLQGGAVVTKSTESVLTYTMMEPLLRSAAGFPRLDPPPLPDSPFMLTSSYSMHTPLIGTELLGLYDPGDAPAKRPSRRDTSRMSFEEWQAEAAQLIEENQRSRR